MSESSNVITDHSGDPKYYIITPQIVLALCDNPYQYTLWNVIKNVAGELGECYLATNDLATMAMMSAGKCSESRKALIEKGLLQGEIRKDPGYPQPVWHLVIPNLWQDNIKWREAHQSLKERIELKALQLASLHKVKPSHSEEGIPPGEEGIPPGETKKNQKAKPKAKPKEATPPPHISVETYRTVANRYPDKATWATIELTVGSEPDNLAFWEQVIRAYIGCGWNKLNITAMLDFYRRRILPSTKPQERTNGRADRRLQPTDGETPVTNKDAEAIKRTLERRRRATQGTPDTARDAAVC